MPLGSGANTCCSHPMSGETVEQAVHRRLKEEMGFDCEMKEVFSLIYKAEVGNDLTEYEYDHFFFGRYDGRPKINKKEAMAYKWVPLEGLKEDLEREPERYTPWLRIAIDKVVNYQKSK